MYARTNRCYNERGSRTNYVCSSVLHCISVLHYIHKHYLIHMCISECKTIYCDFITGIELSVIHVTYFFIFFTYTLFWILQDLKEKKKHTTKTYEGLDVQPHSFLTSGPDGCTWLASCHGSFTAGEKPPIFFVQEHLVDRPKSQSRNFGKQKNLLPILEIKPWLFSNVYFNIPTWLHVFKNSYMFMF